MYPSNPCLFQLHRKDLGHEPNLQEWLNAPFWTSIHERFMDYSERFSRVDWAQVDSIFGVVPRDVIQ